MNVEIASLTTTPVLKIRDAPGHQIDLGRFNRYKEQL